MTSKKIILLI